jgi:hypothetical protein
VTRQHPRQCLDHRDVKALFARGRRHLEADVAAADDDQAESGLQLLPEPFGILDRAQTMQIRHAPAGRQSRDRQRTRTSSGGEHQFSVAFATAIRQPYLI